MRSFLLLLTWQFTLSASTDWQALGINSDPPDLTEALKVTTETGLNLRTGPGEEFPAIVVIPANSTVQVVGWMSRWLGERYPYTPSLWLRAVYGDKNGWVCAYMGAQRYISQRGEPIFPLVVLAPNAAKECIDVETDLPLVSTMEFIAMDWESRYYDGRIFTGIYKDEVRAFGINYRDVNNDYSFIPQLRGKKDLPMQLPDYWWDLSIDYKYPETKYRFADNRSTDYMFSGPGYDSPMFDRIVSGFGNVIWVDGDWVLLGDEYLGFGWIPLQDLRLYRAVGFEYCPEPPDGNYEDQDTETGLSFWKELYPDQGNYEINIHRAYFVRIPWPELTSVEFYQPGDASIPLCSVKPDEPIRTGFHETGEHIYRIKLPQQVDEKQEYRVKIYTSYGKDGNNTVEFVVSPLASVYGLHHDWW